MKKFLAVFILYSQVVLGHEVDSFSHRQLPLEDITSEVNFLVNKQIRSGIENYEAALPQALLHRKCRTDLLLPYLEMSLGTLFPIVRTTLNKADISKNGPTELNESIYKGTKFKALVLPVTGCCDPIINIGGHHVGTDKVDHFLAFGYQYYQQFLKGKSLVTILESGISKEEHWFGHYTTGVKSYADLVANYQGLLFWQDLMDNRIQCDPENGIFYLARPVNISSYVDDAWDEAINCSTYFHKRFERVVESNILKATNGLSCPLTPEKCEALEQKYDVDLGGVHLKDLLLSPKCRGRGPSQSFPTICR